MIQTANGTIVAAQDAVLVSAIPSSPSSAPASPAGGGGDAGACSGTACYAGIGIGVGSFTLTLAAVGCIYCCRARKAARDASAVSVAGGMFDRLNLFESHEPAAGVSGSSSPGSGGNGRAGAGGGGGGGAAARSAVRSPNTSVRGGVGRLAWLGANTSEEIKLPICAFQRGS